MSNHLAIATVTASLQTMLANALAVDLPDIGHEVTTERPDSPITANKAEVRLYLYQVVTNTAWRNHDLPTRSSDGTVVQRPQVALDLSYLLSFFGQEQALEPQRLLGSVVRTLHAQPLLSRATIRKTMQAHGAPAWLQASTLADQVELVKFTPLLLSLEELSKLWSVFFQTKYTLSVAYQGSVVLIDADEAPTPALPVRAHNVYVRPFHQPAIDQVLAQTGADQPITVGSTLLIRGRQLRADITQVRISGREVTPAPQNVRDTEISLPISADLRAGVQGVQVLQPVLMGTPPLPHGGVESNIAAFVLRPIITSVSATRTQVEVNVSPPVGKSQQVVLFLNEYNPPADRPARAYRFGAPSRDVLDAPDTSAIITVPISGAVAGEYLLRVQVDGAESLLSVDANAASPTFNQYIAPRVTLP